MVARRTFETNRKTGSTSEYLTGQSRTFVDIEKNEKKNNGMWAVAKYAVLSRGRPPYRSLGATFLRHRTTGRRDPMTRTGRLSAVRFRRRPCGGGRTTTSSRRAFVRLSSVSAHVHRRQRHRDHYHHRQQQLQYPLQYTVAYKYIYTVLVGRGDNSVCARARGVCGCLCVCALCSVSPPTTRLSENRFL